MKITLLIDNPRSWILPYAKKLDQLLRERGHEVTVCHVAAEMPVGDTAFFLSCEKIVPSDLMARNRHNLVIHESALPEGKGWSPLTWQILEGKNDIAITLFEATGRVDSGPVYFQDIMHFEGHELVDELRALQGKKTIDLALRFVDAYPWVVPKTQEGNETFYRRRTPRDSELDVSKSIGESFNQFRVADNERYPLFFRIGGYTYEIKVYKRPEVANPIPRA